MYTGEYYMYSIINCRLSCFVYRSEPSKSAQVDTYANPEDFIKTPPHMQPQKNERAEDQGEVPKSLNVAITDELPVSHNYFSCHVRNNGWQLFKVCLF